MMIHALMLERRRIGRLVPFASSGAMNVDPPSAKRARSSGAVSVDLLAHASKTNEIIKRIDIFSLLLFLIQQAC